MSMYWCLLTISCSDYFSFFFNDSPTTVIYTLSLHDALPISECHADYLTLSVSRLLNLLLRLVAFLLFLNSRFKSLDTLKIGRAVQQECRDRSRMPSSA